MREFVLALLVGIFLSTSAAALVEVEDEYGQTWECVGRDCYRETKAQDEFDSWLKDTKDLKGSQMTGDPLAMPNKKAGNDPLAMPAKSKNSKDPLAF